MRILLTTDTIGGVWQFTERLSAALCGGNEVALVSFGRAPSAAQDAWVRGMRTVQDGFFEFDSCQIPLEWMSDNDEIFSAGASFLAGVAERFRPDLLHANQFCWGALPRTGALAIPRVVTAHSDVLSWAAAVRPQGLDPSPWLDRYIALVQNGLDAADAVVAPTRWMLAALAANFRVPEATAVVSNGTTPLFFPRGYTPPQRRLQAVSAGRFWDEGKNLSLLQTLSPPLPVLLAGALHPDAPAPSQRELSPPESQGVHLLGELSAAAMQQLYLASSIYICPSLYEPFGLAPLDAASAGCALLLHDLPSLREVWGEAALYFSTAAQLQQALDHLATDAAALGTVAAVAGARAAELSTRQTSEGYARLYDEVATRYNLANGGALNRAC